jgi:hypothetical protein
MTPRSKSSCLLIHSRILGQLTHQKGRNQIANLAQGEQAKKWMAKNDFVLDSARKGIICSP